MQDLELFLYQQPIPWYGPYIVEAWRGSTSDCTIWQLIATIATDCETGDSLMVEIDRSEIDQIVAPFCTIATDWKIRSQ